MESCAGEAVEEEVQVIRADAAVSGRVREANIGVRVMFLEECPEPLQPSGVDTSSSHFCQRRHFGEKRITWQKVRARAFPAHEMATFCEDVDGTSRTLF